MYVKIRNTTKLSAENIYLVLECRVRVINIWIKIWNTNSDKLLAKKKKQKNKGKDSSSFFKTVLKNSEFDSLRVEGKLGVHTAKNSALLCHFVNSMSTPNVVFALAPTYSGIKLDAEAALILKVKVWKMIKALIRGRGEDANGHKKHN